MPVKCLNSFHDGLNPEAVCDRECQIPCIAFRLNQVKNDKKEQGQAKGIFFCQFCIPDRRKPK